MEPENITPAGSKKKFLIITLVVLFAVGVALGYLFMQKDTPGQVVAPAPVAVTAPVVTPPRIYTDAEKRQALEAFAKNSATGTISEAEKLRALKSFSVKTQAPLLSDEEKRKALEAFASSSQSAQ